MSKVQTIDRAFQILEFLSNVDSISLNELSKELGLNKTTTFRILNSLKDNGYVTQHKNLQYCLTFKLFRIGNRIVQNIDFAIPAKSAIATLALETNQIVHLVVKDDYQILYIDKFTPENHTSLMSWSKIGKRAPMYCTAAGKALLAHCDEKTIRSVWENSEIIKYTSRTITNYETLLLDLKRIKKNGYSTEYEEYELGLYCIGAVFFNYRNEVVGAISISIPLSDHKKKDFYVNELISCCRSISKKLGYEDYYKIF